MRVPSRIGNAHKVKRRSNNRYKVDFITIVPSPYQRDLFRALAAREEIELSVHYMEMRSPDSPWPESALHPHEAFMPGFWLPFAGGRVHLNWRYPELSDADFVVLASYASITAQWLMRGALRGKRWLFWGERLRGHSGWRHAAQSMLMSPVKSAAAIVGIGSPAEEDYRKRFPNKPLFCIPYHCDLSNFQVIQKEQQTGKPFTFLFCGQMIYRKGIDLLIEAFQLLVAKKADVSLVLVGREAELPHIMNTVDPVAQGRITYAGFQSPDALPRYFADADAFVMPSRYDGWGVVINQALGAGLPIIASDAVGAAIDCVDDGVNGLIVPAGEAAALRNAMEFLASHPDLACRFGEASRVRSAVLTPEVGAEKWVKVFDNLSPCAA